MKRILFIAMLFFIQTNISPANTINEAEFFKTLNLTEKQSDKIENIENEYGTKISKLNAEILLKKMAVAQLQSKQNVHSYNVEISELQKDVNEIQEKKEEEISSSLGFFQRIKYRKYRQEVAANPFYWTFVQN